VQSTVVATYWLRSAVVEVSLCAHRDFVHMIGWLGGDPAQGLDRRESHWNAQLHGP